MGGKEMHLHMLTFDSEPDSSTAASKGGQWIDKSTMELKAFHNEEDDALRDWAEELNHVSGELPVLPLVEVCWEWTNDRMAIADINQDKPDELLMKRVPYYGIAVTVPYILIHIPIL